MRGIRLLQEVGVDFHVISVLTLASLDYPDEMFWFYVDNGVQRVGFNVEEIEGVNTRSSLDSRLAEGKYAAFMARFHELSAENGWPLRVREFEAFDGLMREGVIIHRSQQSTPFSIVSVDVNGNFSTFSPELLGMRSEHYGDFILGNVYLDELSEMAATPKLKRMSEDVESGVDMCRKSCAYFPVCGGGSPGNKYFENGTFASSETMYCRLTRKVLTDVLGGRSGRPRKPGQLEPPASRLHVRSP